ncbi:MULTISPECIES: protein phosphatase CheZ [Stappiaceae]|jgi:chemotaxis regulatin CheY-phosphate phosphatase CheZ|uniref:Chemotaxis regulator CheZ n=1 Tax=Roseibium aggregatum TaxID=187304 RepID=A0A0M6XZD8_9HYPH|nr:MULTISPECIES: protein phosphatase CheZ [Stappiaceae]MEC9420905.1 protein phosphatase CheZ [Pseudomonadota bacterium]ERP93822.1 chemotaxis protein [Labrenzia sp. C1B10]ERS05353.1 chemotaxis protein [Labrenzia sp. C1B70]MEE2866885.1 protein phosphatase CheZ [Pseudomonadota bacterium]NKI57072.1 chemotaxis protein [Labrenzia sp. PO1]
MKAEAAQEQPELIGEAEYQTLEQTLMESDRGRRFLKEFLNRNKTPETTEILTAIGRLEKMMTRQRKVPDLDKIRLDIADMHEAIERTKAEIANIKAEGEESNRFVDASHELDAIVTQTEGATQSILEAAEQIQEKAWVLRENGADDAVCDDIDAKATEIFMACSFQDLTGQRTNKVVQVLRYLESRINLMINIWGIQELEAEATAGPVDTRPDAHLLNGPQLAGGVSQNNVDELMSVSDDVFDAALKETGAEAAPAEAPKHASEADVDAIMASEADVDAIMAGGDEPMDAAAIDDMFASAPAADDEEEDDEFAGADPDATLDEAAIERLFDSEVGGGTHEAADEAEADAEWELTEEVSEEDGEDPLKQLSEAERQALFN